MDRRKSVLLGVLAGIMLLALSWCLSSFSNRFVLDGAGGQDRTVNLPGAVGPAEDGRVVLAAVGDIMLSRVVEQKMIAQQDWRYPFLDTAQLTRGADLAFGNLETPILAGKVVPTGSFLFRTDPQAVEGLRYAGFDILSLANNHMLNRGREGLASTLQVLDEAGVGRGGAGLSEAEIYAPAVRTVKGVRFGFLSYTYAREQSRGADGETYGTAYMETEKMRRQVASLRESVEVVVVSMHAGTEYASAPHPSQTAFARAAIDAGAQLVLGHHPHTVQTFEKYQDGYIIYSLGNFVFDQMWSEETRLGAVARITFENKRITSVEFTPTKIYDYAQPRLAEGADKQRLLDRLRLAQ